MNYRLQTNIPTWSETTYRTPWTKFVPQNKSTWPTIGEYVLVRSASGTKNTPYAYSEAKYEPNSKGWTNCNNDRITDRSGVVLEWMPLP